MIKLTIATVSGDPGGARAIAPVIQRLEKNPSFKLINFTYNEASAILASFGITTCALPETVTQTWIKQTLEQQDFALLLCSTSYNNLNWEKYFIEVARVLDIFSMSILDFWSNYVLRFGDEEGKLRFVPNRIAVMDDAAKQEMVQMGFPKEQLMVTGQPAFDILTYTYHNFSLSKKKQSRESFALNENHLLITFLSQPLKKLFGNPKAAGYLPFNEEIVLNAVIQSLNKISSPEKPITLLIRPHPREQIQDYQSYVSDKIRILVSNEDEIREHMMASDLVIGMNTVLLVEACYLSCITLSIQPGLEGKDSLPTNAWGVSTAIYRTEEITQTLEQLLFNNSVRHSILTKLKNVCIQESASEKIAHYIQSISDKLSESVYGNRQTL